MIVTQNVISSVNHMYRMPEILRCFLVLGLQESLEKMSRRQTSDAGKACCAGQEGLRDAGLPLSYSLSEHEMSQGADPRVDAGMFQNT